MPKGKRKGKKKAAGRGAPKGNRNAVGHGAPAGNANAETHGAYSRPRLTPEEQSAIDSLTDDFEKTPCGHSRIWKRNAKTLNGVLRLWTISRKTTRRFLTGA